MKKCPFCKAELEDNARFCLYCMAQLDEKSIIALKNRNKKLRFVLIGAILCLLITAVLLICFLQGNSNGSDMDDSSQASSVFENEGDSLPSLEASDENSENSVDDTVSEDSRDTPVDDISIDTSVNTSVNTSVGESSDTNVDNGEENSTNMPQPLQTVVYKYRDAVVGDEWGSISVENAITIIGVESPSADGTYFIPDTIDGKRVIAIAMYAFSDENISNTVKKVIVSESVKNIHNYAFANCYNMTDIYLCGEAVAGSPLLFLPEIEKRKNTITLHASATCHNRNLRTYKSIYSYEAWAGHSIGIFEEWNGWE